MDNKIIAIINEWNPFEIYSLLQVEYEFESKMISWAAIYCKTTKELSLEMQHTQ